MRTQTRRLWIATALAVLVTGGLFAARSAPAQVPNAPSIEDTVWEGVDLPENFFITYQFKKGGALVYSYNGQTYQIASWKQEGNRVYFEVNNKYRECRGIVTGDQFQGESWNKAGASWKTNLKKVSKPK